MWARQILLALIGLSAGVTVAGGLFAFIVELGVISDFADRTHTGKHVLLYESSVMLGGILGNLVFIYGIPIRLGPPLLAVFGLLAGTFVGCWAMALAEILNIFPVFIRRIRLFKAIPYIIVSMALGRGLGGILFFFMRW